MRKFEGNPEHPGSRGRNCAKGPATINQVTDPDRILYPMSRSGPRGSGRWERVSWDEALDALAARIRAAITENRRNEIMVHLGRPGEDGYTERVLASWGVDGHNSHTNVCSSGGRTGFQFWMGIDRPSPDHAHAKVIYLISAHLESGHYFNPHAQRITEARANGAKVIVLDTRLSNTATHADYWLSPQPGSEAAINLAIANHLIQTRRYDRDFVRRWWNWAEYLTACHPGVPVTFEAFEEILAGLYAEFTFGFAAAESGHRRCGARGGRLGGRRRGDPVLLPLVAVGGRGQPRRLAGVPHAVPHLRAARRGGHRGRHVPQRVEQVRAAPDPRAAAPGRVAGAVLAAGVPAGPERDVVPAAALPRRGPRAAGHLLHPRLQPGVDQPRRAVLDGGPGDEDKVGCFVALTPTWNESAWFADYVLPMGHGSERHDTHSYEQYDGQWVGFRQPVLRAARDRRGEPVTDTRQVNPGEVWEENEFWIELSWRIDPDGSLGIRQYHESRAHPGSKLTVDEYYGWMFAHSVPGLPERAAAEGLSPLEWMRRYGAFEITRGQGAQHEQEVPAAELADLHVSPAGRVYTSAAPAPSPNIVPAGRLRRTRRAAGRPGCMVDGVIRRGFPTPSGRLEFWSSTLAAWGWPEHALPGYIRSHVHPSRLAADQVVLLSTFRLPTQIHTRSANAKWLDELAHTNPVWIHPADAARFGVGRTGDLVRVETEIGYFVAKAWITEGIRPGVVACSHHMGRWRLDRPSPRGAGGMMATVGLRHGDDGWRMERRAPAGPYASADPDSRRIWWSDTGVHQNLTFSVHPDPISGMHCWHQAVRVSPAAPATGMATSPWTPAGRTRCTGSGSPDPPGRAGITRRHPAPALADAPAQAGRRGVRNPSGARPEHDGRMPRRPPAAGRWELLRALGAVAGDPADARTACAALGWAGPDNAEHTELFVLNCPPYASVYLGAEGGLGGEGADRVAGFWRAMGLAPPAEPDHLAALLGLYASLGEAAGAPAPPRPPTRSPGPATRCSGSTCGPGCPATWTPSAICGPRPGPWARLARRALLAERGAHPGGWLPLALRAAPEPGPAADNLDALLDMLITPVRSGFILTRRRLAAGAEAAGAGHRIGERRFTLRALLEQDPAGTLSWLAGEAARWSRRHASPGCRRRAAGGATSFRGLVGAPGGPYRAVAHAVSRAPADRSAGGAPCGVTNDPCDAGARVGGCR